MDFTPGTKKCKRCGEDKYMWDFPYRRGTKRDEIYANVCNDCIAGYTKTYYAENKKRFEKQRARYYQANSEYIRKHNRKYKVRSMERGIAKYGPMYEYGCKEYQKRYHREYYQRHRERFKEYNRRYRTGTLWTTAWVDSEATGSKIEYKYQITIGRMVV